MKALTYFILLLENEYIITEKTTNNFCARNLAYFVEARNLAYYVEARNIDYCVELSSLCISYSL